MVGTPLYMAPEITQS
jgi:serine/threonine protein kinase